MKQKLEHILVIRLSAMGDAGMLVPVLQIFHKTYPNIRLTVLTKPFFSQLFDHLHFVNVQTAQVKDKHKGVSGLFKLSSELPYDIDAVADMHNVLRSKILRKFLALKGLKIEKIIKGRKEKKKLTRLKVKQIKPLKSTHQRYADVFSKLGFEIDLNDTFHTKRQLVSQSIIERFGFTNFNQYIGFAPFAAHEPKALPFENTKKLLNLLTQQTNAQILLFGGGKQEIEALQLLQGKNQQIAVIAGETDFKTELKIISNLDVMIAMDSGNGHLAAMFNIPTITIWGATHPFAGFAPFQQPRENQFIPDLKKYPFLPTSIYGNKTVKGYETPSESINLDLVVKRVLSILQT